MIVVIVLVLILLLLVVVVNIGNNSHDNNHHNKHSNCNNDPGHAAAGRDRRPEVPRVGAGRPIDLHMSDIRDHTT